MAANAVIGPTIDQLRAYCPALGGRVAGAAQFQLGLQNYNANMPLPAGYVIPLEETAEGDRNQNMTGLYQIVDINIGVVVELDATPDRRGQAPVMTYDDMRAALWAAVLNWSPVTCRVPNSQGFFYGGMRFLDLDRARLFYQYEFTLRYQITNEDGWLGPPGEALRSIELDIYKAPPFAMPPADGRPPAAVAIITTNLGTDWDDTTTAWDDGGTTWDVAP